MDLLEPVSSGHWHVDRRGALALVLISLAIGGTVFYFYHTTLNPVTTQPKKTLSASIYQIYRNGFEGGGISGLNVSDSSNPTATWTIDTGFGCSYRGGWCGCYEGSGCAYSGYSHNMNSTMTLNMSGYGPFVNYTSFLLNFTTWVDTDPTDVLFVEYRSDSSWNVAAQYGGHMSTTLPLNETSVTAWLKPQLTLPTSTGMIRFRFLTGCCAMVYTGVYLDLISLYGVGPPGYERVDVFGEPVVPGSSPPFISIPVSIDGGPYYKAINPAGVVSFMAAPGNHTLTVSDTFTEGSQSYKFASWTDGVSSPSMRVNVPGNGAVMYLGDGEITLAYLGFAAKYSLG